MGPRKTAGEGQSPSEVSKRRAGRRGVGVLLALPLLHLCSLQILASSAGNVDHFVIGLNGICARVLETIAAILLAENSPEEAVTTKPMSVLASSSSPTPAYSSAAASRSTGNDGRSEDAKFYQKRRNG